ncbi:MAG: N-acetylmuramoyl-L-alanine amidase [Elusimicrobia bacterium]|nr:N-acetylmuramoyl-L-alanine amidase [Elusimicrobiota bacterium]
MKKILFLLFSLFIICLCFAEKANNSNIETQKLNVVFDGINYKGMQLYTISDTQFFSIKEIAALFSANLEWQSVSQKVIFKMKNKTASIYFNSKKVNFGKKKKKLDTPSLLIDHELYVPVELLTLNDFSEMTETVSKFSPKNSLLTVCSKSNISAVRYYTKENSTQVVIDLEEKMFHSIKKGKNSIIVSFQRGKITKDSVIANNGAIKDINFETKNREAVITINLAQTPKLVTSKKYKKPLRLVIDIEHTIPVNMAKPCEITIPETLLSEVKEIDMENQDIQTIEPAEEKTNQQNINENTANSSSATDTQTIVQTSTQTTVISQTEPPQIDERIIANDSQVYEKPILEYDSDEQDKEMLSKIKTVSISEDQIIDNSYEIIDDTETFKDIIPTEKEIAKDAKIIVLDAGHGGMDSGAIGPTGVKEKDINLEIVFYLRDLFKKDKNYKTILTRFDDTFIPLAQRTNIANENNADLFVSVHCNANFNRAVAGFEIYFLSENASDSAAKATAILENSSLDLEDKTNEQKSVLEKMLWSMVINEHMNESSELCSFIVSETKGRLKIPNKGIKQANFFVLRGTQMPAVLVECAYLSNYTEEAKLQTSKFQKAIADSIYEGVKKYYARKANEVKK